MVEIRAVCFDWGGTLMAEDGGPEELPMAQWPEVRRLEGAYEALASLSRRLPLHIATNAGVSSRPMIERALQRVGLAHFITDIFCFADIGHRKAERAFWEVVSARLALPLNEIAMVGDSREQDAYHPGRFGVHAFWLNRGAAAFGEGSPQGRGGAVPEVPRLDAFVRWVLAHAAADVQPAPRALVGQRPPPSP